MVNIGLPRCGQFGCGHPTWRDMRPALQLAFTWRRRRCSPGGAGSRPAAGIEGHPGGGGGGESALATHLRALQSMRQLDAARGKAGSRGKPRMQVSVLCRALDSVACGCVPCRQSHLAQGLSVDLLLLQNCTHVGRQAGVW